MSRDARQKQFLKIVVFIVVAAFMVTILLGTISAIYYLR